MMTLATETAENEERLAVAQGQLIAATNVLLTLIK